jgi:hypothetical protein
MAMICTQCGTIRDKAFEEIPGSVTLEVLLFLCGIIPGLLYATWRNSRRRKVCPACGSEKIVGLSSPVGQKLKRDLESDKL